MNLVEAWDIVWDNEPFHWLILTVLILAVAAEFYSLWQYWRLECYATIVAIQHLKGKYQETAKILRWKNEHLQIDAEGSFIQQDGKFLLMKYPDVLARSVPHSSLRFVISLCTAIGVLGTFYGIQQGLQEITLDTSNAAQLMASSTELLQGMKTAFSTSLMGLGSGSLFTLVLFVSQLIRQKQRRTLCRLLDEVVIFKTLENANRDVVQTLRLVTHKLAGMSQFSAADIGEAVGKSIAEKLTGFNQLNAEAISQAISQQLQSELLPVLQGILQEQQKLRELQENQGKRVLEILFREMQTGVIEPIAQRLDASAELTQQVSHAVLTLHQDLGNSTNTIQKFQQDTLVGLNEFTNNLKQTLNQFQTDTQGVLEQTAQNIHVAVEQSIQGMAAQQMAFETSAERAATTFRGIRKDLQAVLETQAEKQQDVLQSLSHGVVEILNSAHTVFTQHPSTLKTVSAQASELINNRKNHHDEFS